MARREESSENENDMSEVQRLSIVEKSVRLDRVLLLLLALLIILTLAVTITIAVLSSISNGGAENASAAELAAMQAKVQELRNDLQATRLQLETLNKELPALKATLQNSSAPAFQKLMLDQEKSFQEFIKGVKEGMYDLARMVPGSRTWLELYSEKMDKVRQLSVARQRNLQRLNTGEILIEPD
jgi:uncharacterized protein YukE